MVPFPVHCPSHLLVPSCGCWASRTGGAPLVWPQHPVSSWAAPLIPITHHAPPHTGHAVVRLQTGPCSCVLHVLPRGSGLQLACLIAALSSSASTWHQHPLVLFPPGAYFLFSSRSHMPGLPWREARSVPVSESPHHYRMTSHGTPLMAYTRHSCSTGFRSCCIDGSNCRSCSTSHCTCCCVPTRGIMSDGTIMPFS